MLSRNPITVAKLKAILENYENSGIENAPVFMSDLRPLTRVWLVTQEPNSEIMVILSDPEGQ